MIKVSETAKKKVIELMSDDGFNAMTDFVRVGVKVAVVLVCLMI